MLSVLLLFVHYRSLSSPSGLWRTKWWLKYVSLCVRKEKAEAPGVAGHRRVAAAAWFHPKAIPEARGRGEKDSFSCGASFQEELESGRFA